MMSFASESITVRLMCGRTTVRRLRIRASLDQVPFPVDDDAELVTELLGVLLIEDVRAEAKPHPIEEERLLQGRAVVDGEIVLRLVGRLLPRGPADGIPPPGEEEVVAQALDELLEIVGRADPHRLLPGAVEVLVDEREVPREAPPRSLDGVAGTVDPEGARERQVPVDRLDACPARLGVPELLATRPGQEPVADSALVGELGSQAQLPVRAQRPQVVGLRPDAVIGVDAVLVTHVEPEPLDGRQPHAGKADAVVAALRGPRL